jgi:hypothetical protein
MLTEITHKFVIVDEQFILKKTGQLILSDELPTEDNIKVHDDVVLFIWNTLKLIKCRNYKNEKEKYGLYYDGSSYIYFEQLELFFRIILNWLSFADLINEEFIINDKNDKYDKFIFRDDLEKLSKLIGKALQEKKGVLHIGV